MISLSAWVLGKTVIIDMVIASELMSRQGITVVCTLQHHRGFAIISSPAVANDADKEPPATHDGWRNLEQL